MNRVIPIIISTAVLWVTWVLLTGSLDPQELGTGLAVSILVAILSRGEPFSASTLGFLHPKRLAYALYYIPYLFIAIVRSNFDVARRVISPRLPINPGIVKVKTRLKNPLGRLFLTSSITLTPGTLTVDIHGDDLYIHWIDVRSQDIDAATQEIVSGFEKYLEVIFG